MTYLYIENRDKYLEHHGIKNQKWGVRHGPPYPLNANTHNKVVAKGQDPLKGSTAETKKEKTSGYRNFAAKVAGSAMIGYSIGTRMGQGATGAAIGAAAGAIGGSVGAVSSAIKTHSAEKRKSESEIDKKTGLRLKRKEMSAEEDLKAVNPGYHNFNDNTKNNCRFCTIAYDMRRRGYEVTAIKSVSGDRADNISKYYKNAKLQTVEGKNVQKAASNKDVKDMFLNSTAYERVEKALVSQGNGARGEIDVSWDTPFGGGHSMAYEVKDGKVSIFDAQVGKKQNLHKIVNHAKSNICYIRLDNLEPNYDVIKELVE